MYYTNQVVMLTAQPSADFVFVNWTGDVGGMADVSQATLSVVMDDNRTITANFVPATTTYTVTIGTAPGGSIALQPAQYDYLVNENVSVSAIPNTGYAFDHWTGDLFGKSPTVAMQIRGDKFISAIFNPTLTIQQSVVGGGEIEAVPDLTPNGYTVGTAVSLTVHPSIDYLFDGWTGDVAGISDVRQVAVTVVVDTPRTLMANFVAAPRFSITTGVQYEGAGSVTLQPAQPPNGYVVNQKVTAYAVAGTGYAFSQWTGDASGTSPILALGVDGEKSIVAVFDPKVTVQCDPVEGGEVEITPPRSSGGYLIDTEITTEAIAGKGYKFKSWSGDLSGSDNPASIGVDSPKTLTALFVKESEFPWWWIIVGIVVLFSGLIVLRLAYVLVRQRSEAA